MFTPGNIGDDEPILTIFQIGLKPPSSFFLISIIALILSLSLSLSVFFCDVVYVRLKNFFEACTFWYTSCTVVFVHLVFVGFHGCFLFTGDVLDCNWDGLHTFLVNWQESHSRSVEGGVKNSSRLAKGNAPNCSQQWSGKDGHQDIVYHRESCHPVMLSEYQKGPLHIPRPSVWVSNFRPKSTVFGVFFGAENSDPTGGFRKKSLYTNQIAEMSLCFASIVQPVTWCNLPSC